MQPPGSDETWVLRDLAKLDGVRQRTELLEALVLDLPDAFAGHIERPSDLVEGARMLSVQSVPQLEHLTLPAGERPEDLPLGAHNLVQLLDHVHGHPDRSSLVGQRARHRLTDPPGRVRRELEAFAVVELLRSADESDRPLLDQIEEGQTLVPVLLGDRDDETEIGLDHLLLRTMVATLDPLRELDLLRGGEEVDLADVLEEELQGVSRDLARLLDLLLFLLHAGHDLDLKLLERVVKVVDLGRLQVELVERDRDFVRAQLAVLPPRLEERLGVLRLHEVDDGLRCNGYLYYAHSVPPSWTGVLAMPHCAS